MRYTVHKINDRGTLFWQILNENLIFKIKERETPELMQYLLILLKINETIFRRLATILG